MSTVSACLIVKNELASLPRCLASIRDQVDQIVVVDTGSTDGTDVTAERLGAEVRRFQWCDDFAAARNASLAHATGDWIFWLDADEELVESEPGAFRDLIAQLPEWGCLLDVKDVLDENVHGQRWNIFPNHRGLQFRGRIHEQPHPWPANGSPAATDLAYILHHGYAAGKTTMDAKAKRNLDILLDAIRRETDPFLKMTYQCNLGRTYWYMDEGDKCAYAMRAAAKQWEELDCPLWQSCHVPYWLWAAAALKAGAYGVVIGHGWAVPPQAVSAELLCCMGDACIALEHYIEASYYFRRAVTDSTVIHPSLHEQDKSTTYPLHRLGQLDVLLHA